MHKSFPPQVIKEGKEDTRKTSDAKQIISQVHLQDHNNIFQVFLNVCFHVGSRVELSRVRVLTCPSVFPFLLNLL